MLANTIIGSLRSDSGSDTQQEDVSLREKMLRQAGKIELENIPFHPDALLQGIVRNYQPMASQKEIGLPETTHTTIPAKNKHPEGFLKGMKLLVVEDNSINIRILELQLKNSGALIETASNGRLALEKIKQQPFDGIILDLHMPEMNGYETIPHIRQLQPDAFIIVLTADIMPEVTERLARLQIKDMLPKPYAAEDLLDILAQYNNG